MLRIGILSFASAHAESYARCVQELPNARLVGIADADDKRGREMAERFRTRCLSRDRLLAEVDAVIVTSENARHREWVVAAAGAGRHVLCEKPIATEVADARRMIEACATAKLQLGAAFPCRYMPAMRRLKARCDSGELGKLLAAKGTNHGRVPSGWLTSPTLAGGGAVMDHTVHVADLLRWMLKAEVVEVYAEVDRLLHDIESDDCAALTMTFDNGVFATLDPSWSRPQSYPTWGDLTLQIVGSKGVAAADGFAQKLDLYDDRRGKGEWQYWGYDPDLGLVADFVDAVEKGRPFAITGADGLRALEVALAAYRSAAEGRPVRIEDVR